MKWTTSKIILLITMTFAVLFMIQQFKPKADFQEKRVINTPENSESPTLKMQDLSPNSDQDKIQQRIKKIDVESHGKKDYEESRVQVNIQPTDDFYKDVKNNDNDIKKTLKETDLKKPPLKGEVKISF